ncbi:ion channel [Virgibacillus xinjiangensis]|uniref:Ion channel n=1 Tax=Virgibacillus xinjiangensis TaxID=393090 RepID=A0ABV7CWR0_9BACI
MLSTIFIGVTILFLIINLYYFFTNKDFKKSYASPALFFKLVYVFISITLGFAVLYQLLSLEEAVLVINDPTGQPASESFLTHLYYSGVTILSVGYGDLVPVGPARLFSLVEAGIGLLLPSAYFMKAISSSRNEEEES